MKEFKIGDRVKALSNLYKENGKIGTVVKVDMYACRVNFDKDVGGWGNAEYGVKYGHGLIVSKNDLIMLEKPTKQELLDMPVGTKIITDRDISNVYIKVGKSDFCNDNADHIEDTNINNDLSLDPCFSNENKIIKIEKPTYETVYDYGTEVQDMTIPEIEKELGHPFRIVKEKNKD